MFSFFTSKLNLAVIAVVIAMASGSVWYWNYSQEKFAEYERELSQYEEVVANQSDVIVRLQDDITEIQSINTTLTGIEQQNQERMEDLRGELEQLEEMSSNPAKREELEIDINKMSEQRSRCQEVATGSPVTESDLSNTLCPSLMDNRYENSQ